MSGLGKLRKARVVAAIFILAASGFGCANDEAEKVKKLEIENGLLRKYKADVEKTDRLGVQGGMDADSGCIESEELPNRTPQGCTWSQYAEGLKKNNKALGLGLSERDMAMWGLVGELNNRYLQGSGAKEYGLARFHAMASAMNTSGFMTRVEPSLAMEFIRNYMKISQKDFTDILARTNAGETTQLAQKKEENKEQKNKKVNDNKLTAVTAEERRIFCETGGILPTRGVSTKEAMEQIMGCKTPVKKGGDSGPRTVSSSTKKKWSYEQAMKEACDAGKQYREDVDLHGMKPSQARYEAQQYSKYLAENSPAPQKALYDKINQGLWMDSCF